MRSIMVWGAYEENLLKKSDIICICMNKLGRSNYQDVVLVGDTKHDAVASQQLGVGFIAAIYGFGFANETDAKRINSDFVCSNSRVQSVNGNLFIQPLLVMVLNRNGNFYEFAVVFRKI